MKNLIYEQGSILEKGYGFNPIVIWEMDTLTIEAKAIYLCITAYASVDDAKSYPTVETICQRTGISRNRFYRHFNLLVDADLIRVTKHRDKNQRWENNVYTIVMKPEPKKQPKDINGSKAKRIQNVTRTPESLDDTGFEEPDKITQNQNDTLTNVVVYTNLDNIQQQYDSVSFQEETPEPAPQDVKTKDIFALKAEIDSVIGAGSFSIPMLINLIKQKGIAKIKQVINDYPNLVKTKQVVPNPAGLFYSFAAMDEYTLPPAEPQRYATGMNKKLDFNNFPQHEYTEDFLESLFDVAPEKAPKKYSTGLQKKLDFNRFPQHEYTEADLEHIFERFDSPCPAF